MNEVLYAALPELLGGLGTALILTLSSVARRALRTRAKD